MAITPEQAGQITNSELKEIEKVEASIDAKLALHFQNNNSEVSIGYNIKELSSRAREVLLDRYIKAGWQIIRGTEHDCRGEPSETTYTLKAYALRHKESSPVPTADAFIKCRDALACAVDWLQPHEIPADKLRWLDERLDEATLLADRLAQ